MANLFEETDQKLRDMCKTWDDVLFIRTSILNDKRIPIRYEIDKDLFIRKAKEFDYENEPGTGNSVNLALEVIGDGWWLERFNGPIEGWVFQEPPYRPDNKIDIKNELRDEELGLEEID